MRRSVLVALLGLLAVVGSTASLAAQEASPAFSATLLSDFGYPEIALTETGSGLEDVPAELPAGRYLVTLRTTEAHAAYVNFAQVPDGLSDEEAQEQLLSAARDDVPVEGWVFAGGSYALPGQSVSVVVELPAGEWHVASTRDDVTAETPNEQATLYPLTITEAQDGSTAATPAGSPAVEPEATATVEMQDTAWGGLAGPLPAGPQIWRITNTGEQPRQMVLWRTPRAVTVVDMEAIFTDFMSSTPTAASDLYAQFVWVGYAAILSPGYSVWLEFDLEPGTYTAISYVTDPETGMPAALLGMVQSFEVE